MKMLQHTPEPVVDKIREFVEKFGPRDGIDLNAAQISYRISVFKDPFWLEYLDIDPEKAKQKIKRLRIKLESVK